MLTPASRHPTEPTHPRIRLVAADLDGTLLDEEHRLRPSTVRAVQVLARIGIPTVLATGRMFCSALPFARELGLTGPVVAYQGALIREAVGGRTIHHDPLPLDLALEILDFLEPEEWSTNLYVDDTLFVERPSEATRRYERLSAMSIHPVGRLTEFLAAPATKIGVGAEPHEVDELSERLRAYFGRRLNIVKTWPFYLEMTNPTASKSRALELLGAQMGFVAAEVLAFGDSYNDADMLDWAGTGVAMGDAPDVVKAAADETCEGVEEDGFARFLSRQDWFPAAELGL